MTQMKKMTQTVKNIKRHQGPYVNQAHHIINKLTTTLTISQQTENNGTHYLQMMYLRWKPDSKETLKYTDILCARVDKNINSVREGFDKVSNTCISITHQAQSPLIRM